jgi:acetyltransferase-like isoleucine patch superfamily enzyme
MTEQRSVPLRAKPFSSQEPMLFNPTVLSTKSLNSEIVRTMPLRQPIEDPLNLVPRVLCKLYSTWVAHTYPFASRGKNLSLHWSCLLSRRIAPRIELGNSVIIRNGAWFNVLPEAIEGVNIRIGDHCLIGAQDVISAKNLIDIEQDVIIGTSVLIQDHNHAYEDVQRPIRKQGPMAGGIVRIGAGSWIGHGASIVCNQDELIIGRNSVVAANALVTKSFPPYSVIVGNPARLARQYDRERGIWVGATGRQAVAAEIS